MATGKSSMLPVVRGIILAALFVSLWSWIAFWVRRFDPLFGVRLPGWLSILGWPLATFGGILGVYCVIVFRTRGHGTPAPFDPPTVFVATGPYRYTRNPMYVGAVATLFGAGLILGSPSIAVLSLIFLAIAHAFVVFQEEPSLARRFGESYASYRRQVSRWLPLAWFRHPD